MRRKGTTKSKRSLLVNAEPFGFGPTAAIADFFPGLREEVEYIAYAGVGHTLHLQRPLPYDEIIDLSAYSGDELQSAWERVLRRFDRFLTAMDFGVAKIAVDLGIHTTVYDAIPWFWPKIPEVAAQCDLYIAQNFFGVEERLAAEAHKFRAPVIVPPIVPNTVPQWKSRDKILINLGGLNNPSWSEHGTRLYARLIVEALCGKPEERPDSLVIACNAVIADELKDFGATNLTREQMQEVLARSRYALMTPGLGNIYDAARFGTPTVWLPPVNDSQGRQLGMLQEHGMVDGNVDWHDFMPGHGIDYRADQQLVLGAVAWNVIDASRDDAVKTRLAAVLHEQCDRLTGKLIGNATALMFEFGSGGAQQVAELVAQRAKKRR